MHVYGCRLGAALAGPQADEAALSSLVNEGCALFHELLQSIPQPGETPSGQAPVIAANAPLWVKCLSQTDIRVASSFSSEVCVVSALFHTGCMDYVVIFLDRLFIQGVLTCSYNAMAAGGRFQGTLKLHSGNIRGTFREHLVHIQGTFSAHSVHIQGTFSALLGTFRGHGRGRPVSPSSPAWKLIN
jgi:hypothetical protein